MLTNAVGQKSYNYRDGLSLLYDISGFLPLKVSGRMGTDVWRLLAYLHF